MRWVRIIAVIGFLDGALAHLRYLVEGGIHAYAPAPVVIQVLFHILMPVDALTALLILRRRASGVVLAVAVMLADLTANWWLAWPGFTAHPERAQYLTNPGLLTVFGLFIFVTAPVLHRGLSEPEQTPAAVRASPPVSRNAGAPGDRGRGSGAHPRRTVRRR